MPYQSKLDFSEPRLRQIVSERYGLAVEIKQVKQGYFSTTARLSGKGGDWLLKVYREKEVNTKQLAFGVSVSEHLGSAGLPAPLPIRALDGSTLLCVDGHILLLWPFLDGLGYVPGDLDQLKAAAAALGEMHLATTDVPIKSDFSFSPFAKAVRESACDVWRRLGTDDLSRLPDEGKQLRCLLNCGANDPDVDEIGSLPTAIIHGDFRGQNLLFKGSEISGILDLDGARPAPRLFDTAYAVLFFQSVIGDSPLCLEERKAFLCEYDRVIGLTEAEARLLPDVLTFSLVRGLTLWLKIGLLERANDQALAWIEAYSHLIEWIESDAGSIRFLA